MMASLPNRSGGTGQRPGRPPQIDRAAIAQAASEIPLTELSLRSVADRLGVSVPGLYHYVRGRDELFALAAEQSVRRLPLPVDHDQHWAVWLLEWGFYTRNVFASDPVLLKQYIGGGIGVEVMADKIDAAMALCIRQGFTARDALHAQSVVADCALGAAVAQVREDQARAEGRPFHRELRRILATGDQPLPHLAVIADDPEWEPSSRFRTEITTILIGIAVRRGEDPDEVAVLLGDI
jgi:AcrR family transcriptional regulator